MTKLKHIISGRQFKKTDIEKILKDAKNFEIGLRKGKIFNKLKNKIIACVFYEPSTRTRLSFETAVLRLGGQVITVENAKENSSAFKGETIEDTTKVLSSYADAIVMRHYQKGEVEKASKVSIVPVINAGDGANEHPTQALLDLYTIKKELGKTTGLNIVFVGDLLYSRTLHSLLPMLLMYQNNKFYFVTPKELKIPEILRQELKKNKVEFYELDNLENVLPKADVLYMTRVQKERFKDVASYNRVKDSFILENKHLLKMKKKSIIMHPLPRINEIEVEVDKNERAVYFRQVEYGVYVRMALLSYIFSR